MDQKNGFSALVLVIIIGISSLIMAKGGTWLGLRELDMGTNSSQGKRAAYVAEACIEEALLKFQKDKDYSATEQKIYLDDCACTYGTISDGTIKTIESDGTCGNFTIGIKVAIDISDGIEIKNWEFK